MQQFTKGEEGGEEEEEWMGEWGAMWQWVEAVMCHRGFAEEVVREVGVGVGEAALYYMQITGEEEERWIGL